MKIYTKTGDYGETSLFSGERVRKSSPRVELCGTVDELNTVIGLSRAFGLPDILDEHLRTLSNLLFKLGADLATLNHKNTNRISLADIDNVEAKIDLLEEELPKLKNFIKKSAKTSPFRGRM